jgi:hypothetical protein
MRGTDVQGRRFVIYPLFSLSFMFQCQETIAWRQIYLRIVVRNAPYFKIHDSKFKRSIIH